MHRLAFLAALAATVLYSQEDNPDHRLRSSAAVFHEIMSAPDKGIPKDLLSKAQCVVIVPGLKKAAFVFGGEYGRGFALCRSHGEWGSPAAVRFSGGSFGAQIGGESTERRDARDEPARHGKACRRQIHAGRGCVRRRRPDWKNSLGGDRSPVTRRNSLLF